jgi:hypothetical protein
LFDHAPVMPPKKKAPRRPSQIITTKLQPRKDTAHTDVGAVVRIPSRASTAKSDTEPEAASPLITTYSTPSPTSNLTDPVLEAERRKLRSSTNKLIIATLNKATTREGIPSMKQVQKAQIELKREIRMREALEADLKRAATDVDRVSQELAAYKASVEKVMEAMKSDMTALKSSSLNAPEHAPLSAPGPPAAQMPAAAGPSVSE